MELQGLHILLTYQCILECDHCFVLGSPNQSATLTIKRMEGILDQAEEAEVKSIYFEGGEPFLYYALLLTATRLAAERGFKVGIVTNGYWAIGEAEARLALLPFEGLIEDLSVSTDLFHWSDAISNQSQAVQKAAVHLGLPVSTISIAQPHRIEEGSPDTDNGLVEDVLMYRGRAVMTMADEAPKVAWHQLDQCPYENLADPGRLHLDPLGWLHICQGISMGNLFQKPLVRILDDYQPASHPVIGPLIRGGPAELVRAYDVPHEDSYADACHLCYRTREALRSRFPDVLGPDPVYGVF